MLKMEIEILPIRMNMMWYTITSAWLFIFGDTFQINLDIYGIVTIPLLLVFIVNLWNNYRREPIMDERKQKLVTDGMAWGFISIILSAIIIDKIGIQSNLKNLIQLGFWIWILYISSKTLYQNLETKDNKEI